MIRINTSSGETFKLDLSDESQAKTLVEMLGDWNFQQKITAITALRQYKRRHRCPNSGCKQLVEMVCPKCGPVNDGGNFTYTGNQYTIVKPNSFDRISFSVESSPANLNEGINGTEKLICHAGEIQLSILTYEHQPAARVILTEIGEQRYNPKLR